VFNATGENSHFSRFSVDNLWRRQETRVLRWSCRDTVVFIGLVSAIKLAITLELKINTLAIVTVKLIGSARRFHSRLLSGKHVELESHRTDPVSPDESAIDRSVEDVKQDDPVRVG